MTKYIDLRENKTPLEGVTRFEKLISKDFNAVDCFSDPGVWNEVKLYHIDDEGVAILVGYDDQGYITYIGHAGAEFNQ